MKAQISFVEYIISFSIFGVFVAYMFFRVLGTMPVYADEIRGERLKNEAFQLSEFLINDPGDPVDWDTVSGGSQTSCPSGWWNSNWQYRKKLTFDNSVQSQGLNNFTTLVKLSLSNFDYSKAKSDGTDLRFIDSDNTTELKYHIEKWNTAGESFVWVKVPNIPASSNSDHMWMYYGNPSATNSQDEAGTYDSNYAAVWHLGESSGTIYDSTTNNNDGICAGTACPTSISGTMGGAYSFDGLNDRFNITNSITLDLNVPFSVDAWVYPISNQAAKNSIIYSQGQAFSGPAWTECELALTQTRNVWWCSNNGGVYCINSSPVVVPINAWSHIVGTYNGTYMVSYLNGVEIKNGFLSGSITEISNNVTIGAGVGSDQYFIGRIDEIRVSKVSRSISWIKASYLTMMDQFITYSSEEACGTVSPPTCPSGWWNSNWQYRKNLTFNNSGQSGYSTGQVNTTLAGQPALFSFNWTDGNILSGYIFSTNNSGSWKNDTWRDFENQSGNALNITGFESGSLDKWRNCSFWSGECHKPIVQAAVSYAGAYSVKCVLNSTGPNGQFCQFYTNFSTPRTILYARHYFRFNNTPPLNGQMLVGPEIINTNVVYDMNSLYIVNDGGTLKWRMLYRDGGTTLASDSTSPTPTPNTWYYIESKIKNGAGNGEAKVWIAPAGANIDESSPTISKTGLTNNDLKTSYIDFGLWNSNFAMNIEAYHDNVVTSSSYIGPYNSWSNVTKTLNSTVGTLVQWKFYANDTNKNWKATNTFSLVTTGPGGSSENLNDFTVLVKLSTSSFDYSKAKSDGTDLRFIDPDNSELKYHIEKWNTAGESFVWVKVPNIPASSNTDYMWMYYGNPSATNSQDESGTYDSNHVGVWHLHSFNSTNGTLDSTQYSNDGRAYNFNTNPASTVAGKIGNATKFDGVNDYVNCGKNSALNVQNITAMAWFNSSEKGWNVILFKENYGVNGYWFGTDASGYIYSYIESAGSGRNTESTTVITDGIMHFVVMTYNGSEWNFYIDGKLNYTKDYASYAPISASTNDFYISYSDPAKSLNGTLDEVRVSNIARSSSWIRASYLSMSDQFITYSSEESCSAAPPPSCPSDWWNSCYLYRQRIDVKNNAASPLAGYSVSFKLDTTSLVNAGKVQNDGDDLRILYKDGSNWIELDRNLINFNSPNTEVWFKTYKDVPASGTDNNYYVYYGCPTAVNPPNNLNNIYIFYDDFSTNPNNNGKWTIYRYSNDLINESWWDPTNKVWYLTKAFSYFKGMAAFTNYDLTITSWKADFSYLAGGGDGADGLVFMSYKDRNAYASGKPAGGGNLGFSLCYDGWPDPADPISGYGVEFDNFRNYIDPSEDYPYFDPSENHIGIIKDNVDNHLTFVDDGRTEDNMWHNVEVAFLNGQMVIKVDGGTAISYTISNPDYTYKGIGFGSGTGGLSNNHVIDNFRVRKYVTPEPSTSLSPEEACSETPPPSTDCTSAGGIGCYSNQSSCNDTCIFQGYAGGTNMSGYSECDPYYCCFCSAAPQTKLIKRIGLSSIENITNLLSMSKISKLNSTCQGDGYYDVKNLIGTSQDFYLTLRVKPSGNLILSCHPPRTTYRGVNATITRYVVIKGASNETGEFIVRVW